MNARTWLLVALAVAAATALCFVAPIHQDPGYHLFADRRMLLGIPHFWNVITNVPFLLVALWGARALRRKRAFEFPWEGRGYAIFLVGIASVAIGSGYYHARPNDETLVWDRLPMTIGFMALLAIVAGERVSPRAGRLLLWPLIAIGIASVVYWRLSGDLRVYGLVQFYPMVALPLMLLLFPARYTGTWGYVCLGALYVAAKLLEAFDRQIGDVFATGGHPWKHVAAAAGVLCWVVSVERRRKVRA